MEFGLSRTKNDWNTILFSVEFNQFCVLSTLCSSIQCMENVNIKYQFVCQFGFCSTFVAIVVNSVVFKLSIRMNDDNNHRHRFHWCFRTKLFDSHSPTNELISMIDLESTHRNEETKKKAFQSNIRLYSNIEYGSIHHKMYEKNQPFSYVE